MCLQRANLTVCELYPSDTDLKKRVTATCQPTPLKASRPVALASQVTGGVGRGRAVGGGRGGRNGQGVTVGTGGAEKSVGAWRGLQLLRQWLPVSSRGLGSDFVN